MQRLSQGTTPIEMLVAEAIPGWPCRSETVSSYSRRNRRQCI